MPDDAHSRRARPNPPSNAIGAEVSPLDERAQPHMVAMRDGVKLATDVYLPEDASRLVTLLVRLPYDKCGRYTFMPQLAAYVNARGFAVVAQDVRGKFRSEGAQEPFVHEVEDGYDTLDWIESQEWSDGQVGMYGDSYYGFTQWAAVASGHRALKAIMPRVTGTDFYEGFGTAKIPRIPSFEWLLSTWSDETLYESNLISDPPPSSKTPRIKAWLGSDALETLDRIKTSVDAGSFTEQVYGGPNPAAHISIPAFHVIGYWDNVERYSIRDWVAAQTSPAAAHQFLRLEAMDHENFGLQPLEVVGENHEVNDEALARYLPRTLDEGLDFLRHYTATPDPGPWSAAKVSYEHVGVGRQTSNTWPPKGSFATTLYLGDGTDALSSPDGGTVSETPASESIAEWIHDPSRPVPFLQETDWGLLSLMHDESGLHERPDVATFTFAPTTRDIAGEVRVELLLGADSPSTHLIVRLFDVDTTGAARYLVGNGTLVQTPSGPVRTLLTLGDIAYRLADGHQLRVAISSSAAGLYLVHPGTGEDPWTATDARSVPHRLHLGGAEGSRLIIDFA